MDMQISKATSQIVCSHGPLTSEPPAVQSLVQQTVEVEVCHRHTGPPVIMWL